MTDVIDRTYKGWLCVQPSGIRHFYEGGWSLCGTMLLRQLDPLQPGQRKCKRCERKQQAKGESTPS